MTLPWTHIVIHHSASEDHESLDTDNFRRYHTEDRGWRDVGYHYIVERVEDGYEVIIGRPLTMNGAHAPGFNTFGIGVVFAGDYTDGSPPLEMLKVSVYRLIRPLMRTFDITRDKIIGHRDTGRSTECPGNSFDVETLRRLL